MNMLKVSKEYFWLFVDKKKAINVQRVMFPVFFFLSLNICI